jgi:predicted transcriptional regulator
MTKTALEEYVAILIDLAHQIPLKPAQIESTTHIHIIKLKKRLAFLTEIGAIKVQTTKKISTYKITPYGTNILRFFKLDISIYKINQNNKTD